jgi:N-hydroxyarylamine O-acetyltransferase
MNSFFMGILEALGYTCFAVTARILTDKRPLPPVAHRATLVTLGATQYLCDVGFGGAGAAEGPVDLTVAGVQDIRGRRFSIRRHEGGIFGDITLVQHTQEGESDFYTFYQRPHSPLEFIALNYSMYTNPAALFSMNRMVKLRTKTGSLVIDNKIFRKNINGKVIEEEITTNKRLYEILTGEFNMIVPKISFSTDFPREWF